MRTRILFDLIRMLLCGDQGITRARHDTHNGVLESCYWHHHLVVYEKQDSEPWRLAHVRAVGIWVHLNCW
jgi:hypothetical protein